MASIRPSPADPPARDRLFAIPELVENIILHGYRDKREGDLLVMMAVSTQFRDIITTSPTIRRIVGFEQYPDSVNIPLRDEFGSAAKNPLYCHHNNILGCWIGSNYGNQGSEVDICARTEYGAPNCQFRHILDAASGHLEGHLRIHHLETPWLETEDEADGVPQKWWKKGECKWRNHSYKELHLSKKAKFITVELRSEHAMDSERRDGWKKLIVKVKGSATFGQTLDIAKSLVEAADWHAFARVFHGDHACTRSGTPWNPEELAWLQPRWWFGDLDTTAYDTKMNWSWQQFVDDSLLDFVVEAPSVQDNVYPYHDFWSKMIDRNDEFEIPGKDEPTDDPTEERLDWIGADLA